MTLLSAMRRLPVECVQQQMRTRRRLYCALQYNGFCVDLFPIQLGVGIVVRAERGAFERNASECPAGPRIAENFGTHGCVCLGRSAAALRSGRGGSIRAELYLAGENTLCGTVIHEQQHEIGCFTADLKTDAPPFKGHHRRGSPRTLKIGAAAASHYPTAITRADDERCLQ